jgi:outer membrane murein-binding lipoprotein Lpp
MMKKRIDTLSGKVARLNNSVDIWKADASAKGNEVGELKRRLHFLKKKNGTTR